MALPVDGEWSHGTYYAYDKRGCRCDACFAAARERHNRRPPNSSRLPVRSSLAPWHVADRTVLARTCTACGRLLDAEWFHRRNTLPYPKALMSACIRCTNDVSQHGDDRRRERRATAWREVAAVADRNNYEWTDREDAVLMRTDMTVEQMARSLGRTVPAVRHRRRKIEAPALPCPTRVVPVETWRIGGVSVDEA